MAFKDLKAYTGNQPYIFISYSHKDEKAEEMVRCLIHGGYRVWYDEGIPCAERFNNVIAKRIKSSRFFIPLFSDNFFQSNYCPVELDYARRCDRSILPVYLEKVELPEDIDMHYGGLQSVFLHNLSNYNEMLERIANALGIELCRELAPDKKPEPPVPSVEDGASINVPPVSPVEDNTSTNESPVSSSEADSWTSPAPITDFHFEVSYDGVTINEYTGAGGAVVIPSEIDRKPVTAIGCEAFERCTSLSSVTIPDSVTSIGKWTFSGCTGLISVTIPGSVISIGDGAFSDCTGLTSVTIPNGVKSIMYCALLGCTSLTSVTIPDSVTCIGDRAFLGCSGLTSITIPDSVTSIGGEAFYGCTSLTSVTIPDSVTSVERGAFLGCTGLTSVTIPDSVTSIGEDAFNGCTGLTSVTIPGSVISIGDWAFEGCTSLISVTIPDNVTSIGKRAFDGCIRLKDVYYTGLAFQWKWISIRNGLFNSPLKRATIHYNTPKPTASP